MKFTAQIKRFDEIYPTFHIPISNKIYNEIILKTKDKRIICTINSDYKFHCALLSKKTFYFIMLSQEVCKKNNYQENDFVELEIVPDKSKYGMEISEEFEEVLFSDPDGNIMFEKLTNGKKRSLIFLISKVKNSQSRIEKCFVILEHLKRYNGRLDFKRLNEDFKNFKNKL